MEVIYWLGIVMWFVSSATAKELPPLLPREEASTPKTAVVLNSTNTDEVHQYCKESCEDVCQPCSDLVKTCTHDENDCGLEQDPTFGGVCPPHAVCVPKNQHCKSIFGILRN